MSVPAFWASDKDAAMVVALFGDTVRRFCAAGRASECYLIFWLGRPGFVCI